MRSLLEEDMVWWCCFLEEDGVEDGVEDWVEICMLLDLDGEGLLCVAADFLHVSW